MSQQGLLQQSIRDITGTELDYNGDWLALMASDSITTGSFNERLLAWINVTLGTSYTNLPEAQQAFAVDQGYTSWSHMGAIVLETSLARTLLGSETQGLALDFTDDYYQADTGHYGSAYVLDTGTPANDYDSHPYGLLTYTSPSAKMTMGPSGTLRFGAHNLYVNSASPADQSITVVSGATYSVDITGSVSVTASGAATGTWTAGSNTFTAATTTLTLGSTSGSGTVVCRRTPSDTTYLATTSAARYALPNEWDSSGNNLGILVEEARTNLCLYSDDLTNAAWTKSNLTTAKTATGPDGVANSATKLTATANNGVALQRVVSASAARSLGVYLKRRTGTGGVTVAIGETTGSEKVSNGTFTTDTTGWSATTGCTISSTSSRLRATEDGSSGFLNVTQTLTLTAGKIYRVSIELVAVSGPTNTQLWVGTSAGNAGMLLESVGTTPGTFSYYFVASTTSCILQLVANKTNSSGTDEYVEWDNVSVFEVAETTVDLSSGGWVRGVIENKTITNPCVVVKLATSGDEVDVAFAGVENGGFVTSVIPTLGSTVTRAADNISLATSGFPLSAAVGTLFIEWSGKSSGARIYDLSNGSSSEWIFLGTTTLFIVDGGVDQTAPLSNGTFTVDGAMKNAAAFAANDVALSVNGAAASTDASATLPTVTAWRIGSAFNNGNHINGYIKRAMYLPRRMSNADLQSLST